MLSFQPASPLQYFAMLVADDKHLALTEAAVSIAQDEYPGLDPQSVLAEIDTLGARLQRRLAPDAPAVHRLRMLNRYFFQELGFGGNVNDYYDPDNSHLNQVLLQRRGIPISLAVVYLELAGQLGLQAHGVSFPGHFLVKFRLPRGEVVIDPFTGQSLSREELLERIEPYKRRQGLVGDFDMPLGLFLQAAAPREILARMLRNLKEIHRSTRDLPRLIKVLDRLVVLLPRDAQERRDRGLAWADQGRADLAASDLAAYLDLAEPASPDRGAISRRLVQLRRLQQGS